MPELKIDIKTYIKFSGIASRTGLNKEDLMRDTVEALSQAIREIESQEEVDPYEIYQDNKKLVKSIKKQILSMLKSIGEH